MRTLYSPSKYYQGKGIIKRLPELVSRFGSKVGVITDKIVYDIVSDDLSKALDSSEGFVYEYIFFGGESTYAEAERIATIITEKKFEIVVGIGGGKVIDTAKLVADKTQSATVIVPTAASSDAACSHGTVVYNEAGTFVEAPKLLRNPDIVIVDTKIIAGAPIRTLRAGIGDAFATFYEARACKRSKSENRTGGVASYTAYKIAEICKDALYEYGRQALEDVEVGNISDALENVIEANTYLSGVGYENNGLAIAHATCNGITYVEQGIPAMHGEVVGYGTLLQLWIEGDKKEFDKAYKFFEDLQLKSSLGSLGFEDVSDYLIRTLAESIIDNGNYCANMPMKITEEDIYNAMKELESRSIK